MPVVALTNFSMTPRNVTVHYATPKTARRFESRCDRDSCSFNQPGDCLTWLEWRSATGRLFPIESDGSPGDVGSQLVSKSNDSLLREVEFQAKDLDAHPNGGVTVDGQERYQIHIAIVQHQQRPSRSRYVSRRAQPAGQGLLPTATADPGHSYQRPDRTRSQGRSRQNNSQGHLVRSGELECGYHEFWPGTYVAVQPHHCYGPQLQLRRNSRAMRSDHRFRKRHDWDPRKTNGLFQVDNVQVCVDSCGGDHAGDGYPYDYTYRGFDVPGRHQRLFSRVLSLAVLREWGGRRRRNDQRLCLRRLLHGVRAKLSYLAIQRQASPTSTPAHGRREAPPML